MSMKELPPALRIDGVRGYCRKVQPGTRQEDLMVVYAEEIRNR